MDELIKANNELEVVHEETVEVLYGEVLDINSSTPGIDYTGILNKVFQCVDIADILLNVKKGVDYVVNIPPEFQKGFEAGEYWIMENMETGDLWPSLMEVGEDGRNHIVTPLKVKKQEFVKGNPFKEITENYNNLYLQQKMKELSGLIEQTLNTVARIEQGQTNDRVGLLNAGRQGILLAMAQKDDTTRGIAFQNAIAQLNQAQNQIFETYNQRVSEFKPIPKSKVLQFARELTSKDYTLNKEKEYNDIIEYFTLYLQSTEMLASAYIVSGDTDTAKLVYDKAIERMNTVDYTNLKTIEYSQIEGEYDKIYLYSTQYIEEEKVYCLANKKQYDMMSISITGDKLLEVLSDGKEEIQSEKD